MSMPCRCRACRPAHLPRLPSLGIARADVAVLEPVLRRRDVSRRGHASGHRPYLVLSAAAALQRPLEVPPFARVRRGLRDPRHSPRRGLAGWRHRGILRELTRRALGRGGGRGEGGGGKAGGALPLLRAAALRRSTVPVAAATDAPRTLGTPTSRPSTRTVHSSAGAREGISIPPLGRRPSGRSTAR